jgi:hypothetical protein
MSLKFVVIIIVMVVVKVDVMVVVDGGNQCLKEGVVWFL